MYFFRTSKDVRPGLPLLQALTAINAFNGRPAGPNKKLVVKFADQK